MGAPVHRRGNTPHLLHVIFHQLNGEMFTDDQEMMNVNCLAAYSREMIQIYHMIHVGQSRVLMKLLMQVLLRLREAHNL